MQYVEVDVTVTAKVRVAMENDDVDTSTLKDDLATELDEALQSYVEDFTHTTQIDGEEVDGDPCAVPLGVSGVVEVDVTVGEQRELEEAEATA